MKISELVSHLNADYFLPSIQREFVWLNNRKEQRIEKLFDSILQEYPIGNIMTWKVGKSPGEKLPFSTYKFIESYSDESVNEESDLNGVNDPQLVLDGQQRLTALLIGLKGKYSYTKYNRTYETKLFINLFGDLEDIEDNTYGLKYEFRLNESSVDIYYDNEKSKLWLRVGKVLDFNHLNAEDFKDKYKVIIDSHTSDEVIKKLALKTLGHLHYCICSSENAVNVVVVLNKPNLSQDKKLDRVLNIFVRANDGGVKLEKSDLLLSFMESHRELFKPNGARKEVLNFVESLNKEELIKPNYNFTKDDILKASLMITGLNLKYKVSNFTSHNLNKISNEWEQVKASLTLTVKLLAKYGFTEKTITSKNALLPIAYYIHKNNLKDGFIDLTSLDNKVIREMLVLWLTKAMISGTFGGSSDTVLEKARKLIDEKNQLLKIDSVDEDLIKDLILRSSYKSVYSDLILKLVTPVNHWGEYEQDHMHPKSKFGIELKNLQLTDKDSDSFVKKMNSIGNIGLLNPRVNNDKRAESLSGWLNDQAPETKDYLLIPTNISHEFKDFLNFVVEREKIIIQKLNSVLGYKQS